MAQQLRVCTALVKDQNSVPSTHIRQLKTAITSSSREILCLWPLHQSTHVIMPHAYTYMIKKIRRMSIILINSKNYCFWSRHNYSIHKDTRKRKFEKPTSIIRTQGKRINSQKLSSDFQKICCHTRNNITHTHIHAYTLITTKTKILFSGHRITANFCISWKVM